MGSVGSSPDDRRPRRESERSIDETRRERKLSSSSGKGARTGEHCNFVILYEVPLFFVCMLRRFY